VRLGWHGEVELVTPAKVRVTHPEAHGVVNIADLPPDVSWTPSACSWLLEALVAL
jgi:hypothetical protein